MLAWWESEKLIQPHWAWTPDLQDCELISLCYLKPLSVWKYVLLRYNIITAHICGDVKELGLPAAAGGSIESTATWEKSLAVSSKAAHSPTRRQLIYAWYFPKRNKNICPTKTCTQMCAADLFVMAPNWKCLGCLLAGSWMSNLWYGILLRNKILWSFVTCNIMNKSQTVFLSKSNQMKKKDSLR